HAVHRGLHSSLHDALPISFAREQERPALAPDAGVGENRGAPHPTEGTMAMFFFPFWFLLLLFLPLWLALIYFNLIATSFSVLGLDRKSTRLNSSHVKISYA